MEDTTIEVTNRLEQELRQWGEIEDKLNNLFNGALQKSRNYQIEKLDFYNKLLFKYRYAELNNEERLTRVALRDFRSDLDNTLYPNQWQRIWRVITSPIRNFLYQRKVEAILPQQPQKLVKYNREQLDSDLKRIGLPHLSDKIKDHGQELKELKETVEVDGNTRLTVVMSIHHDENGRGKLHSYKAVLVDKDGDNELRTQIFAPTVPVVLAAGLLKGAAVTLGVGQKKGYQQLDFSSKDADGNYRTKIYHADFGYDHYKELSRLEIKEAKNPYEVKLLSDELAKGQRVIVTPLKGGMAKQFQIEMDPQYRDFKYYNLENQLISKADTLGLKTIKVTQSLSQGESEQIEKKPQMRAVKLY